VRLWRLSVYVCANRVATGRDRRLSTGRGGGGGGGGGARASCSSRCHGSWASARVEHHGEGSLRSKGYRQVWMRDVVLHVSENENCKIKDKELKVRRGGPPNGQKQQKKHVTVARARFFPRGSQDQVRGGRYMRGADVFFFWGWRLRHQHATRVAGSTAIFPISWSSTRRFEIQTRTLTHTTPTASRARVRVCVSRALWVTSLHPFPIAVFPSTPIHPSIRHHTR
jgi:hypothetical protein